MSVKKLNSAVSGISGEYYVAVRLSQLGYIASLAIRNAESVDILVSNAKCTKLAGIQVKTNSGNSRVWTLNKKAEMRCDNNLFYIFCNLNGGTSSFFVVPSKVVAIFCRAYHQDYLKNTRRDGKKRKDTQMRKFIIPEDFVVDDGWLALKKFLT